MADEDGNEKVQVTVTDHILDRPLNIKADFINLATAIYPKDHEELANFFKVPLNEDKFFLEAHMKLRPVDFATDGVFVCGLAHYPKPIEESIAQAQAAAQHLAAALTGGAVAGDQVEVLHRSCLSGRVLMGGSGPPCGAPPFD